MINKVKILKILSKEMKMFKIKVKLICKRDQTI